MSADLAIPPAPPMDEAEADSGGYVAPVALTGVAAFALASASLWQREVVRFLRQKSRVVGALGVPVIFWVVIGSGLGSSFSPPGLGAEAGHYLAYFFPGSLALVLLFTAIFSTISIIEDRREGFLQGVLASPASRGAIVMGKVLGGTTLAVLQGMLFLAAAPLLGARLTLVGGFEALGAMALVAFGLTALGFVMAWPMESTQGYHALMNVLLMPMWLMSGALFPASGASGWARWIMVANPLTYGVALLRRLLGAAVGGEASQAAALMAPSLRVSLAVSAGFGVVMFVAAWGVASRRKNS